MSKKMIYICVRCGNPVRTAKEGEGHRRTFLCPYCNYKNYFNNVERIKHWRK